MARLHHPRQDRNLLVSLLLAAWTVTGGCSENSPSPVNASKARHTEVQLQGNEPPEGLDPGIGKGPPRLAAGTMDVGNRYASTLMLVSEPKAQVARCSGIILHPRLVLTAASCVCTPPRAADGTRDASSAGPTCSKRAWVRTVRYGPVADRDFPEETSEKRFHTYEGQVRPHPDFAFLPDSQSASMSSRADLAAILLDSPIEENLPPVPWAETEVRTGELLVMAGYAQDNRWGGTPGIRYFRQNQVTQVLDAPRGLVLYEQRGPFLYNGYAGGPCFRESGAGRWLVGIASQGSESTLSFTHLRAFQDWLQAEVRHAIGLPPALPTPPLKTE